MAARAQSHQTDVGKRGLKANKKENFNTRSLILRFANTAAERQQGMSVDLTQILQILSSLPQTKPQLEFFAGNGDSKRSPEGVRVALIPPSK